MLPDQPHRRFNLRVKTFLFASALLAPALRAQFGIEDLGGRPPRPPIITFLGVGAVGKLATDPSLPPNGPVAIVLLEELRAETSPGGPTGEVFNSIQTRYDEQGRVMEERQTQYGSETDTINRYEGTRLVSRETTFPNSKSPRPKSWIYYTYDEAGKLTELRRGSGDTMQNHVANVKRDPLGRIISFDYRQGEKDELYSTTTYRYSRDGKTIDISESGPGGEVTNPYTETVDDQRHVVGMVVRGRDGGTGQVMAPLNVTFRYDKDGRLVEQVTSAHDVQPADPENELPPGRVSVPYDDTKRTKTTAYSSKEGSISSTLTLNSAGATIGVSLGTPGESVEMKLECTYDGYKNWTKCQQVVTQAGVSRVSKMWRRTLTYR